MPDPTRPELSELLGQMFMIGISGESLTPKEERFISDFNIGFVILFSRNTKDPDKVKTLTDSIHRLGRYNPLIFIDQEGGPVVRFGEKASTFISHMGLAATGKRSYSKIAGKIIGMEMRSLGIDGVFAPCLDVNSRKNNPVIGIRSFSDNSEIVAKFGLKFIDGLKRGGVIPCPKHFPGHGDTIEDSHFTLPESKISIENLKNTHIFPFKKAIGRGVKAVMTAHVLYSSIDKNPGTFSHRFLTSILRNELQFKGIIFSDCLEMDAIKEEFTPSEIVSRGINAGIDVFSVSHSPGFARELIEILKKNSENDEDYAERISDSVNRIISLKRSFKKRSGYNKVLLRKNINTERKIARRSLTVVKNIKGIIPLNTSEKLLVINMKKTSRSTDFSVSGETVSLKTIIEKRFEHYEILNIADNFSLSGHWREEIRSAKNCVIINYSSRFKAGNDEKKLVDQILNIRKNIVVVAADSPYILEHFNSVPVMIATYGSRVVQIEALFDILSGACIPKGHFPVKINTGYI